MLSSEFLKSKIGLRNFVQMYCPENKIQDMLKASMKITFYSTAIDDQSSGRVLRRRSKRQSVSALTSSVSSTIGAEESSLNSSSDARSSSKKGIKRVSNLYYLKSINAI